MQSFQEQDYTKRFDLSLWRKLIKVAKPYHKNLIAVVLFMAVSAIIDVIMPNMNAYAIDVFIANHSTAGLVGFVVAYALLTAVLKNYVFGTATADISTRASGRTSCATTVVRVGASFGQ